jgi:hypothetical protein
MKKQFLGKKIPHQPTGFAKRKRAFSMRGGILMAVPFVAFSIFLSYQPQYTNNPNTAARAVGPAVIRTLGAQPPTTTAADTSADSCAKVISSQLTHGKGIPNGDKIFPVIPEVLKTGGCTPALWDRSVGVYLLNKGLIILNWLAATLAVLLTLYAGLLYISGFAKEENVKKAKTLLIGVYAGLAIVILARVIVSSTVDIFSTSSSQNAFDSAGLPVYSGDNTK